MNWVAIDDDNCTQCGLCIARCECFSEKEGGIEANAGEGTCILCGHCVALCPTMAISHQKMDKNNFIDFDPSINIETDKFKQFIRKRRSHRQFQDKAIPKEVMAEFVDICRYAPTGSNVQDVEILIVQSREKIQKLSDLTMESFQKAREIWRRRAESYTAKGVDMPTDVRFQVDRLERMCNRQQAAKAQGRDRILHNAPAVMIFHAPKLTSAPKDNCVIAAHTVVLTAMTMGLETCYIGLVEAAATYPPLAKELDLPLNHAVFCVLILGYPKMKYLRGVDRKPIRVRWFCKIDDN
ncbi:nitroreductase family protein [Thermodesulfobacteriota bacterium]